MARPPSTVRCARAARPRPGALLLLLAACVAPEDGAVRVSPPDTAPDTAPDPSPDTAPDTAADTAPDTGPVDPDPADGCPAAMARVGATCIDRWEAHLVGHSPYEVPTAGVAAAGAGAVPQGYISGDVAEAACVAAGKRLCTTEEWMAACSGGERTYPYGDTYDAAACNTSYEGGHPVCDYFGTCDGVFDSAHMNDPGINQQPGTVDPAGANPGCVTPEGVYDLHGNLHEWVADADGTFKGGFYADASINGAGCGYTTTAHARSYHDYSTGFRCCAEPG